MTTEADSGRSGPRNLCLSCRYYYFTYEVRQPHGCRAMGFRSLQIPCQVAFENSGMICQLMEPKIRRTPEPTKKAGR
jgi:hypothetical protein